MPNELKANLDYETECRCLRVELKETHDLLGIANCQIAEQSKTISFLEGQIRAFEFCVSKGKGADNG
jgi:hypothetical protein